MKNVASYLKDDDHKPFDFSGEATTFRVPPKKTLPLQSKETSNSPKTISKSFFYVLGIYLWSQIHIDHDFLIKKPTNGLKKLWGWCLICCRQKLYTVLIISNEFERLGDFLWHVGQGVNKAAKILVKKHLKVQQGLWKLLRFLGIAALQRNPRASATTALNGKSDFHQRRNFYRAESIREKSTQLKTQKISKNRED